jgi:hypothetical protein
MKYVYNIIYVHLYLFMYVLDKTFLSCETCVLSNCLVYIYNNIKYV